MSRAYAMSLETRVASTSMCVGRPHPDRATAECHVVAFIRTVPVASRFASVPTYQTLRIPPSYRNTIILFRYLGYGS